jgi:hypothetical protein
MPTGLAKVGMRATALRQPTGDNFVVNIVSSPLGRSLAAKVSYGLPLPQMRFFYR